MWLYLGDALLALGSISSCGSRCPEVAFCYWGMQRFILIHRHAVLGIPPICRDHLDVFVCVDRFLLRC